MSDLKPCPFCGSEARSYYNSSCDCCGNVSGVCGCTRCPAEVSHYRTEAEAIAAWNTRATNTELTRLRRQVEVLRGALRSHVIATSFTESGGSCCYHCGGEWPANTPENHEDGCLASPAAADRIGKEQPHDKD